jgi:hypothetical protein
MSIEIQSGGCNLGLQGFQVHCQETKYQPNAHIFFEAIIIGERALQMAKKEKLL